MLVTQRDDLLRHVQKQYKAANRQLFEGPNAVYAMGRILLDVLNDASLPPTYLLVDALDECTYGLSELLHIITDASLAWRSRVKWLVTSRNILEIERRLQPDALGVKVSLEVRASHVSRAVRCLAKTASLASQLGFSSRYAVDMQGSTKSIKYSAKLLACLCCLTNVMILTELSLVCKACCSSYIGKAHFFRLSIL